MQSNSNENLATDKKLSTNETGENQKKSLTEDEEKKLDKDASSESKTTEDPTHVVAVVTTDSGCHGLDGRHRRGHTCCGCCCDTRRAVVIVNIIGLVGTSLFMAAVIESIHHRLERSEKTEADDDFYQPYTDEERQAMIDFRNVLMARTAVSLVTMSGAILGALYFRVWPLVLNILWSIVWTGWSVAYHFRVYDDEDHHHNNKRDADGRTHHEDGHYYFGPENWILVVILFTFYLYPHFVFVAEVRRGVMTAITYPDEIYSCCCV